MRDTRERGEIKLGTLVVLAICGFIAYEVYKFAPVLFAQYEFKDGVVEEAKFSRGKDAAVMQRSVLKKAQDLGLPVEISNIKVTARGTSTRIQVQYRLTVEWLPGRPYSWDVEEVGESVIF